MNMLEDEKRKRAEEQSRWVQAHEQARAELRRHARKLLDELAQEVNKNHAGDYHVSIQENVVTLLKAGTRIRMSVICAGPDAYKCHADSWEQSVGMDRASMLRAVSDWLSQN